MQSDLPGVIRGMSGQLIAKNVADWDEGDVQVLERMRGLVGKMMREATNLPLATEVSAEVEGLSRLHSRHRFSLVKTELDGLVGRLKTIEGRDEALALAEDTAALFERSYPLLHELDARHKGLALVATFDQKAKPLNDWFSWMGARERSLTLSSQLGRALCGASSVPSLIASNAKSAQEVSLHPDHSAVLKVMTPQAEEEETLLAHLMALSGAAGLMPGVRVRGSVKRGIPQEVRQRGHDERFVSRKRRALLEARLTVGGFKRFSSARHLFILAPEGAHLFPVTEGLEAEFRYAEGATYRVGQEEIDFKELTLRYYEGMITSDQPIMRKEASSLVRIEHHQKLKMALAGDEDGSWAASYQWEVDGRILPYHQLKADFEAGLVTEASAVRARRNRLCVIRDDESLKRALEAPWDCFLPQMVTAHRTNGANKVKRMVAKPYRHEMLLAHEVAQIPDLHAAIVARLTPQAAYTRELITEFQMLDLHDHNIGYAPVETKERVELRRGRYSYTLSDGTRRHRVELEQMTAEYLSGVLAAKPKIRIRGPVDPAARTRLMEVLNGPWEYVLFDLDLSIGEGNVLRERKGSYNIPLRCCLLEGPEASLPYTPQVLAQLEEFDQAFDRVLIPWINRWDAPFRRRLSAEVNQELDRLLEPILSQFSLTEARRGAASANEVTFMSLRKDFVAALEQCTSIWQFLDKATPKGLSDPVCQSDTFESIARRAGISVDELYILNKEAIETYNEGFAREWWSPPLGKQLKIGSSLCSQEAVGQRRQIAHQLFPRLSFAQRAALIERGERRRAYLKAFFDLEAGGDVADFLAAPNPLNSLERKEQWDRADLIARVRPTFRNLACVRYPLLADTLTFLHLTKGSSESVGHWGVDLASLTQRKKVSHYGSVPGVKEVGTSLRRAIRAFKKST